MQISQTQVESIVGALYIENAALRESLAAAEAVIASLSQPAGEQGNVPPGTGGQNEKGT